MKTLNAKKAPKALHPLLKKKINYPKLQRMMRQWDSEDAKHPKQAQARWEKFKQRMEENRLSERPRFSE